MAQQYKAVMKLENAHAKRSITAKSVATRIAKWGNGQRGASVRVALLADRKVDPALQNHSLRDTGKDVPLTTYNMHHAKRNRVNVKKVTMVICVKTETAR